MTAAKAHRHAPPCSASRAPPMRPGFGGPLRAGGNGGTAENRFARRHRVAQKRARVFAAGGAKGTKDGNKFPSNEPRKRNRRPAACPGRARPASTTPPEGLRFALFAVVPCLIGFDCA